MQRLKSFPIVAIALLSVTLLPTTAFAAFDGNAETGKLVFMHKGEDGKACMTCHPAGEAVPGESYRGKKVPNLLKSLGNIGAGKLIGRTVRHLQDFEIPVTDNDLNDLLTFESQMPTKGFGAIPAEWTTYVHTKLGR